MIVRNVTDAVCVDWGNGLSRRLLLASDEMGYSITDTTVRAGTSSPLQYKHHLEACYCIEGTGEVRTTDGRAQRLEPGVMYALDQHDAHHLIADGDIDLRLICVFTPPLSGREVHRLDSEGFSHYAR